MTDQTPMKINRSSTGLVPTNLDDAFRLSEAFHQAQLAPRDLNSPQAIMIAMMQGMELGMSPVQAVQSVAVINNRPVIWGDALIAVVRAHPDCLYVKEWIDGEGDDRVAWCETQRKGEDEPVKRSFSVEDAKRSGKWTTEPKVTRKSRNGGTYQADNDSPWYRYPQRMLQMRARAWCLRDVYADAMKGIQVREEVEDYSGADRAKDVTPKPSIQERLVAQQDTSQAPVEGFGTNDEFEFEEQQDSADHLSSSDQSEAEPVNASPQHATGSALSHLPGDWRRKVVAFARVYYAGSSPSERDQIAAEYEPLANEHEEVKAAMERIVELVGYKELAKLCEFTGLTETQLKEAA